MTTALFIGRFQPLHVGHISAIESIVAENSSLIVGIGSSEKCYTAENPFSCEERKEMIVRALSKAAAPGKSYGDFRIVPIPDINDYPKWVSHVENLAGDFDVVYTGNAVVNDLFTKKGYDVKQFSEPRYISASQIRDMIARGNDWEKFVPDCVASFIREINGQERIRALHKQHLNPVPAVDIIIKYNGGIVLIKRKDGRIALPGGFEEYGEQAEAAAVREAKEETNLDVKLEWLLGVYSDPKRDSRKHIISITYVAEGKGELKAGDDAEDAFAVPIADALKMELAFDHNIILGDYAKRGKRLYNNTGQTPEELK